MARICARCRQPLDQGRDHDCPDDDGPEGSEEDAGER